MNVATLSAKPKPENALGVSNACNNALQPQKGVQPCEEILTLHRDHKMPFWNPTSEAPDAANGTPGSLASVHLQMTAQPASPSVDDAMQLVTSPRTPGMLQSLAWLTILQLLYFLQVSHLHMAGTQAHSAAGMRP